MKIQYIYMCTWAGGAAINGTESLAASPGVVSSKRLSESAWPEAVAWAEDSLQT